MLYSPSSLKTEADFSSKTHSFGAGNAKICSHLKFIWIVSIQDWWGRMFTQAIHSWFESFIISPGCPPADTLEQRCEPRHYAARAGEKNKRKTGKELKLWGWKHEGFKGQTRQNEKHQEHLTSNTNSEFLHVSVTVIVHRSLNQNACFSISFVNQKSMTAEY